MPSETVVPRPASTILLLRENVGGEDPFQVFMMVRHYQIEFASGALVFPGGSVDASDNEIAQDAVLCAGRDGLDDAMLAFRIASIRETFEESGILLARERGAGELISAARAAEIESAHRPLLADGKISFLQILSSNNLVLALDLLVPYAHWITPVGVPKRFDTWFFIAEAPPDQVGAHDGRESTDSIWLSPREALAGGDSGRFKLPFPTTRNLIRLGKQPNVDAALTTARESKIVSVTPIISKEGGTRRLHIPADAGYDGEVFEAPVGP